MNFRDIGNRVYSVLGAAIVAGAVSVAANAYAGGEDGYEPEDVAGVSCKSSADCSGGFYCEDGSCVECGDVKNKKPSGKKVECPEGQNSIGGKCVPVMETVGSGMTEDDVRAAMSYVPATSAGQVASPTAQSVPVTSTGQAVPETRALPSGLRSEEVKCEGECAETEIVPVTSLKGPTLFGYELVGGIKPHYSLNKYTINMSGNKVVYRSQTLGIDGGLGIVIPAGKTNLTLGVIGGLDSEMSRGGGDDLEAVNGKTESLRWDTGLIARFNKRVKDVSHDVGLSLTYGQKNSTDSYKADVLDISLDTRSHIVGLGLDAVVLKHLDNGFFVGGGGAGNLDWYVDVVQRSNVYYKGQLLRPLDDTDKIGQDISRGFQLDYDLRAGPRFGNKWFLSGLDIGVAREHNLLINNETGVDSSEAVYGRASIEGKFDNEGDWKYNAALSKGFGSLSFWDVSLGIGYKNVSIDAYYRVKEADLVDSTKKKESLGVDVRVKFNPEYMFRDGITTIHNWFVDRDDEWAYVRD